MEEKEQTKLAFFLNLGFSLFELIGGIFTNSVAILSDAIHDFGDSLAIAVTYCLEKISLNKEDEKFTFGYKRYSTLGALITSLILVFASFIIILGSVGRIAFPLEVNANGMILFSIFGLVINGYATFKTSSSSKNEKSFNSLIFEDCVGWAAVLVTSLFIKITGLNILDSLLSIAIAVIVLYKAVRNTFKTLEIFLEKKPGNIDTKEVEENILKINGVDSLEDVHIWSVDGAENYFIAHIMINKTTTKENYEKIKKEIKKVLEKENINNSTLELVYKSTRKRSVKK